jgi:hypothetical protein
MHKAKLQDEIAKVAYGLYERRGRIHGCAAEDWVEAERIVMARYAKVKEDAPKAVRNKAAGAPKGETVKPAVKTAASKGRRPAAKKKGL